VWTRVRQLCLHAFYVWKQLDKGFFHTVAKMESDDAMSREFEDGMSRRQNKGRSTNIDVGMH